MIVDIPTLVVNILSVSLVLTRYSNPCVPSGKTVVVIPEPSGQVNAIPDRVTLSPALKVISLATVIVDIPVLLSYTKLEISNRSATTGPLICKLLIVENPI